MADHYLRTIELLEEVDDLRSELRAAYRQERRDPARVADLHADIGRNLKLADIHSTLAVRQELVGIAGMIDHHGVEVAL